MLAVQFQNVKSNDMEQFRDPNTEVILWPPALKTGDHRVSVQRRETLRRAAFRSRVIACQERPAMTRALRRFGRRGRGDEHVTVRE